MNISKVREELRHGTTIYDMPLRVAFYARVSTDKDDQLNSLENQSNYFMEEISNNPNWKFVNGYVDEGISGTRVKNRIQFQKMIDDATNGKIDLILTKEISRFSRNTVDSIKYTEYLLKQGVIVYFLSDNLNTIQEDSEFRLTIMSSLAQDEVRKLSERVKFGIRRMIKDRKVVGGNLTGYYKKNGKYEINVNEAKMIKYLFESYSAGNKSLKAIGRELGQLGYFNQKGENYSTTTLSKMLTNPKYKGYYTANKTEVEDYKTHRKKYHPKEDWIIEKDNSIPSIVSEDLWNRANMLYHERKKRISKNILNSEKFLSNAKYTRKIICNHCNSIYIRNGSSNRKNNPVWICKNYKIHGKDTCLSPILPEKGLDDILLPILKNLDKGSKINQIVEEYEKIIINKKKTTSKKEKIRKLEYQKEKLLDLHLKEIISNKEFLVKNEKLKKEIEILKVEEKRFHEKDRYLELLKEKIFHKVNIENNISTFINLLIDKIVIEKRENSRKNLDITVFFTFYHEPVHLYWNRN